MERKILNLFLKNNKLKFNEIEKNLDIRSNKLAYHMKKLVEKGVLVKEGESYSLSEASEYMIPYLSEKNNVLSIILIKLGKGKEVFLYGREKRPFKGYLSMPGGRLLIGESIKEAVKRIMKTKHVIDANLVKINSVSLENIKKGNKIINSFILIFVEAKT
ncbi:MAG: winged helix-turn-helix transcriptional regulator, partial [archaeon]